MSVSVRAGGTVLPSPTEVTVADEIVWSANTGRTASGLMVGDAVAEKKTVTLRWGVLTLAEAELLREKLTSGFFPAVLTLDGDTVTMESYRGTLTRELLGTFGGVTYCRSASVTLIQR